MSEASKTSDRLDPHVELELVGQSKRARVVPPIAEFKDDGGARRKTSQVSWYIDGVISQIPYFAVDHVGVAEASENGFMTELPLASTG